MEPFHQGPVNKERKLDAEVMTKTGKGKKKFIIQRYGKERGNFIVRGSMIEPKTS
jgi:hypothetical protein